MPARPYYNPTATLAQTNKARRPASSAPTSAVGGGRAAAGLSCIAIEQAIVNRAAYAWQSAVDFVSSGTSLSLKLSSQQPIHQPIPTPTTTVNRLTLPPLLNKSALASKPNLEYDAVAIAAGLPVARQPPAQTCIELAVQFEPLQKRSDPATWPSGRLLRLAFTDKHTIVQGVPTCVTRRCHTQPFRFRILPQPHLYLLDEVTTLGKINGKSLNVENGRV